MTGILILSAVLALGGVVVWIALLLWAFLSANILLFGCEISHAAATLATATRTQHRESR